LHRQGEWRSTPCTCTAAVVTSLPLPALLNTRRLTSVCNSHLTGVVK
jgi:hypothetical protein